MKAKSLILEEEISTKSRRAASRGRPTREVETEATTVREKEAPAGKGPRTSEDEVHSAGIRVKIPRKKTVTEGRDEIGRVAKENGKGRGGLPSAVVGVNRRVEIAVREVPERVRDVGIGFGEVDEVRFTQATADEHED
ncbi:hypothetical protein AXG93_1598s1000 [Marchantia polymorpha subsp. ruderalis]|uniref:Uncharacterized protein n=1 Tax=Marchantia polymorpha subsp. ruderalis TaxID=1480154 RepID=A0A176W2B8_MARPO|nr:hypothetical protein AXG93_1598s1000 [Marchantia polymorpha subsp. ruderalis]